MNINKNDKLKPKITLFDYFDGDNVGPDYINRKIDEAYEADAVYPYEGGMETDEEDDNLCLDIPRYDKFSLEKLEKLRDAALKTRTLTDAENYKSYAEDTYYDRLDYTEGRLYLLELFPDDLKRTYADSEVLFMNVGKILDHYINAYKLLLEAMLETTEKSDNSK